jgi:hypothetical protein
VRQGIELAGFRIGVPPPSITDLNITFTRTGRMRATSHWRSCALIARTQQAAKPLCGLRDAGRPLKGDGARTRVPTDVHLLIVSRGH